MAKILFIEDEPNHIAIYKTKLEAEGFSFFSATNSQEALATISLKKPDLILLDLLLASENGLDILAKLEMDSQTKDIPVIVFTNYDKEEFREQALNLGAQDFVMKSDVTPADMARKIKKILGQKK